MKNLKFAAAGIALCASMLLTACGSTQTVEYKHSKVDANGKFTCELLGIGADFDTSVWTFVDDSTIAAANGASSVSDADLKAVLDKSGALQEMMAMQESGTNVLMVYENTDVTKLGNVSEDDYIGKSVDLFEQQLKQQLDNVSSKKVSVTIAGQSHPALDAQGDVEGETLYSRYICIRKGQYVAIISINALEESEINEITKMFYSL